MCTLNNGIDTYEAHKDPEFKIFKLNDHYFRAYGVSQWSTFISSAEKECAQELKIYQVVSTLP